MRKWHIVFVLGIALCVLRPGLAQAQDVEVLTADVSITEAHALIVDFALQSVAWNSAGDRIVVSREEGVRLYTDTLERLPYTPFEQPTRVVGSVWQPDGDLIASLLRNGWVYVWDANTGAVQTSWQAHSRFATAIAWSPDRRRIATSASAQGVGAGQVTVYNVLLNEVVLTIDTSVYSPDALIWHPNSDLLAIGSNPVEAWNVTRQEHAYFVNRSGRITFAWSPDGSRTAIAGYAMLDQQLLPRIPVIILYDEVETGWSIRDFIAVDQFRGIEFSALAWHPEGHNISHRQMLQARMIYFVFGIQKWGNLWHKCRLQLVGPSKMVHFTI